MSRKIPTVLLVRISARFFSRLVYFGKRQRSPPERKALFPKSAEQLNFFIEPILRPNGPKLGLPLALEGHQREENLDASLGKASAKTQGGTPAQKRHLLISRTLQRLARTACFGLNPPGGRLRGRLALSALLRPSGGKQRGVRPQP